MGRLGRLSFLAGSMATMLVFGISSASAAVLTFTATLSGANENPPTISTAVGTVTVTWDTTAHTMRIQGSFSGLAAPATQAHIHCCVAPPGTSGVATPPPAFSGFPLGATAGAFDTTLDMTDASSYNPPFVTFNGSVAGAEAALLAGLQAGQAYFNIHDATYPAGEIRGFLQPFTAVQVTRFTAARSGRHIHLRWRTGSDSEMLGFYVARGGASHRMRVTPRLIRAAGRVGGAGYSWVDRKPGRASRYWLQIVNLDGSKRWYGPAVVH